LLIEAGTAAKAAKLMIDYLLPNAARFYLEILGRDQLVHARWIAGHILARKLQRISARDVGRAYGALRSDLRAMQDAMSTLHIAGWVTADETGNGKPPTRWNVDPRVHQLFGARAAAERHRREAERQKIHAAARVLGVDPEADA
jgi:hypothetical protein